MQVQHELSVPAVMTMLCSVAAWAMAAVTGVLLADSLSVPARSALKALACIGTLIASVVVSAPPAAQPGAPAVLRLIVLPLSHLHFSAFLEHNICPI